MADSQSIEKSDKSYGAAVSLCMIFEMKGIHHFYLGNVLHGIFDAFDLWGSRDLDAD